jgi:hypothetical protein
MASAAAPAKMRADFLFMAEQGVWYVQMKMTVGAANKVGDEFRSLGQAFLCVLAERSVNGEDDAGSTEAWITRTAAIAESTGCGNCGEQSAVAFVYLRDRGVCPLEYMHFTNHDHAFVVLNRPKNTDESNPGTWGNDAVVCDPWKGRAYKAAALGNVWPGAIPESIYRLG